MITLLLTVFLVVLISAICSMTEAALYSVPWTYIENLRKQGSATGELLYQLRSRIDQPIAAVLTLNTVANTAGAAIAGAVAANVLGADNTALFAAGLTILILALGEILPKTLGVAHACGVASGMARPLRLMVLIFKPFIWFSSMLTRLVASPQSGPSATEDDIRAITSLSRQTGRIQQYEENAIRNILSLDVKHVREIMTPRTMVFSLQEDISVKDAYNHPQIWHYSRIPVYGDDNEDIVGIVLRKDIGRYVSQGQGEKTLFDIMQPVRFVLENQTVDKLLLEFLESRLHLFIVLDEYGGTAGIITLEDILEALGSNLSDFFHEEEEHQIVFGQQDFFVDEQEGFQIEWIVPNAQKNQMEPIILTLAPHQKSREVSAFQGEEFGYVLKGSITIVRGKKKYKVKAKETFYMDGSRSHYLYNHGSGEAKVLWITNPPMF